MLSPARRHLHAKIAAVAAGSNTGTARPMPEDGPGASEYQILLAALGADLNTLRNIESTERKIERKRQMIETYRPWITAAADERAGTQDEIVSTCMIWAIDIQDWELAIKLSRYVLEHGINLPERYSRKAPTLIAEEFAEAEIAIPGTVPHEILAELAELVAGADIFDQVRAKVEKAIGLSYKMRADLFEPAAENAIAGGKPALLAAALGHFERAIALDKSAGVKKIAEGIRRELKTAAPPSA